jgi:hypothetical protein
MMVVEIGRTGCRTVVHMVMVIRRKRIWAIVNVMVVEIWWGCGRSVIAEVVVCGVVVVDVRSVDASCYVVPILQIIVSTLMVVR